ncbi:MAG: GNAT family N-acetyltransferase [Anaerolineaceae bacterium]
MIRSIRNATADDAGLLWAAEQAVVRLHDGLLVAQPGELTVSAFSDRIASQEQGTCHILVAEVGHTATGHGSLERMLMRNMAHVLRLDLCVHIGHWRQGHGRALLADLLDWAEQRDWARKVELNARRGNLGAIELYREFGFHHEGWLRGRVRLRDGSFSDDVSMGLQLGASRGGRHPNVRDKTENSVFGVPAAAFPAHGVVSDSCNASETTRRINS